MATDTSYQPKYFVNSKNTINELSNYILADGFNFVLDLNKSHGAFLYDNVSQQEYLDFFTCYASMPLGYNLPELLVDDFINYIGKAALNKPSNSDVYTEEMATFVKTFFNIAVPDHFKYSFFVSGGALAVENALKTAFDWKVRKNLRKGIENKGSKIIHFKEAFHGRSGYTMSLTNTDENKIKYFPKFDWPRIDNPKIDFDDLDGIEEKEKLAVQQILNTIEENPDDIAGMIIEPIQGEGGDNHFRPEFFKQLRRIADENDILLIFDEVQTGVGITGSMWACEQLDVMPDILCFGKKMQVCGILASERVDEEPENVFKMSSRINSTWGGNLVDMVRATKYLEIIEEQKIIKKVNLEGLYLKNKISELQNEFENIISNARGRGLFCAFDINDDDIKNKFLKNCYNHKLIILSCGKKSIRFRPPLNIKSDEIDEGMMIIQKSLKEAL